MEEYFKETPDWKSELLKENKTLLTRLLKSRLPGVSFVESDIQVFEELLKDPEFRFN